MKSNNQEHNKIVDLRNQQRPHSSQVASKKHGEGHIDLEQQNDSKSDERGNKTKVRYSKKQKISIAVLIMILITSIITSAFFLFYEKEKSSLGVDGNQNNSSEENNGPALYPGLADGVLQSKETAQALPFTVMIENLSTIRPQSGLDKASVVYEALAEGGITRFLVVFAGKEISKIGPVRSARNYYMDWAEEFHGIYAHAGGSPSALAAIKNYDFTVLNALTSDGKYFWRDKTERAPHNLYTKTELLSIARRDKKVENTATYNSWKFKDDLGSWIGKTQAEVEGMMNAENADTPVTNTDDQDQGTQDAAPITDSAKSDQVYRQATDITLNFSTPGYKVLWTYDREANNYKRSNGGQPHTDQLTGVQLRSKNIAVAKVKASPLDDTRLEMITTGSGDALIFHDGISIEGKWKKPARGDRMRFYDDEDREIEFNRGNTWVEIIPPDKQITF